MYHCVHIGDMLVSIDIQEIYINKRIIVEYQNEEYCLDVSNKLIYLATKHLNHIATYIRRDNLPLVIRYELMQWYDFYKVLFVLSVYDIVTYSGKTLLLSLPVNNHTKASLYQFKTDIFSNNLCEMYQNLDDTINEHFELYTFNLDMYMTIKSLKSVYTNPEICDFSLEHSSNARLLELSDNLAIRLRLEKDPYRLQINVQGNNWTASNPLIPTFTVYRSNGVSHTFDYWSSIEHMASIDNLLARSLVLKLLDQPVIFICASLHGIGLNNRKFFI